MVQPEQAEPSKLQKFVIGILVGVLEEDTVQALIKNLLGSLITEQIIPLVPVAVAAAVDAAIKQIPGVENLKDVGAVANEARNVLDKLIPDIDLPLIGNLTDFWRPR